MDVETLKFLLTASEYLKIPPGEPRIDARDLQAVERALPDCDWFELAEVTAASRQAAASLWTGRAELDF